MGDGGLSGGSWGHGKYAKGGFGSISKINEVLGSRGEGSLGPERDWRVSTMFGGCDETVSRI